MNIATSNYSYNYSSDYRTEQENGKSIVQHSVPSENPIQKDGLQPVQEAVETKSVSQQKSGSLDSVSAYNQNVSESATRRTAEPEDPDAQQYLSDSSKEKLLGLYQMYSQKLDVSSQENLLSTMFGR